MLDFATVATLLTVIGGAIGVWRNWPFVKRKVRAGVERLRKMKQGRQAKRRAAFEQVCVDAGMAKIDDVQMAFKELREDIEKRYLPVLPRPTALWTGLKKIERSGVRFDLSDTLLTQLGKIDPNQVQTRFIETNIQGPFCRICHYTLIEWANRMRQNVVLDVCPSCKVKWHEPAGHYVDPNKWKKRIYQSLDAEYRLTGKLRDTDANRQAETKIIPPKPWE